MMRTASLTTIGLAIFAASAQAQTQESLLELCTKAPVTDRTIEICSQLLENDQQITLEQRTEAYRKRGHLFFRQGGFDRAISDFDKVIQSDPEDSVAYAVRGASHLAQGDLDRAMSDVNEAIRLDPASATAYNVRGLTYAQEGRPNMAIADFDRAVWHDPNDASAYANRCFAYLTIGQADRAIVECSAAIRNDPIHIGAYNTRGVAHVQKAIGKRQHAISARQSVSTRKIPWRTKTAASSIS
jgi:tetratricopeptide (TPR) repeat protein